MPTNLKNQNRMPARPSKDDKKKYQALAVVEKLREEEVPELDKVADYLEKFLLGQ